MGAETGDCKYLTRVGRGDVLTRLQTDSFNDHVQEWIKHTVRRCRQPKTSPKTYNGDAGVEGRLPILVQEQRDGSRECCVARVQHALSAGH